MAKIGTLAGYNRVSEVPEDDYLMLENQLGFPLYVVAKEIVNAYRPHLEPLNFDIYSIHCHDGIVAIW